MGGLIIQNFINSTSTRNITATLDRNVNRETLLNQVVQDVVLFLLVSFFRCPIAYRLAEKFPKVSLELFHFRFQTVQKHINI